MNNRSWTGNVEWTDLLYWLSVNDCDFWSLRNYCTCCCTDYCLIVLSFSFCFPVNWRFFIHIIHYYMNLFYWFVYCYVFACTYSISANYLVMPSWILYKLSLCIITVFKFKKENRKTDTSLYLTSHLINVLFQLPIITYCILTCTFTMQYISSTKPLTTQ